MDILFTAADFRRVSALPMEGKGPVAAFGLPEAHKSHIAAALGTECQVLLVTGSDTAAVRMHADIRALGVPCALLLKRELPLVHVVEVVNERTCERIGALSLLASGRNCVVVTDIGAVMQTLPPVEEFHSNRIVVGSGDDISPRSLMERLVAAGYERVDLAETRGQAAMRGGIMDVFAPDAEKPVRIEFWGDTIDQMRTYDPVTQRSEEQVLEAAFPPAFEAPQPPAALRRALKAIRDRAGLEVQQQSFEEGRPCAGADVLLPLLYPHTDTLFQYLADNAVILADEPFRLQDGAKAEQSMFVEEVASMLEREEGHPKQAQLEISAEQAFSLLCGPRTMALYTLARSHPELRPLDVMDSFGQAAPQFMGSIEELSRDAARWREKGQRIAIFAGGNATRIAEQLEGLGVPLGTGEQLQRLPEKGEVLVLSATLPRGFCYPGLALIVLGELELYGRSSGPQKHGSRRGVPRIDELSVGGYVVHEVHGIGRFLGVESLTVQGNTHDYLLLEYRGGDRLYIPTDQIDRIRKYVGGGDEDTIPHLSKLGGSEWQTKVAKAKSSVKKLAVDLAALYAGRIDGKGFAFSPDGEWQKRMEEAFPYQETPDQLESIREIKADMERPHPMDRLLCGDVGYGKTEVALRAAFKAVQDSKQVAFLVPTTILAQQHYHTAAARFADYPVRVACLSRFTPPQERVALKKKLASGEIDVVIGTHALLAKDVKYKDLGLLIIDEEQRFGVNHKEKLKELRSDVDVLTLTATPIPRTLNMSMTGVRDISIIDTPPTSRYPVQTFVTEYTDQLVMDAVTRELARGGQVYIVYNRVQNMESFTDGLRRLLPEARIIMGHGQMGEDQLEKTMLAFMEHEADVLVCSTIIESGLDIPNVNTMIVVDAEKMGLSQLYQLRGRVGRSNRIGYAYLTVPRGAALSEVAHKRLSAIREFTDFGSGFRLAMRDLEIRGAGSLLGAEQHGQIADVGYDYYCKLMRNAMAEVKGEAVEEQREITVDIPFSAFIPKTYIPEEMQRLGAYRRIADAKNADALQDVREELEDRYGDLPLEVENMLTVARLRSLAAEANLASVTVRDGEVRLVFAEDAHIDGGKLFMAVSGMKGAQLTVTVPPAIMIRDRAMDAKRLTKNLPQFLYTVASCCDTFVDL